MDAEHARAAERVRQSAMAWCDAWNWRDLDAVMGHYADDVAFSSPTVVRRWAVADGWLHGRDRPRAHFEIGMQVPGLRFELAEVLHGAGAVCILYRRETGVLVADLVELEGAGRAIRVVACYGEGGTPPPGEERRPRMTS